MTLYYCPACEVGWDADVPCWNCGQPGEPGAVVWHCLKRPARYHWGPPPRFLGGVA